MMWGSVAGTQPRIRIPFRLSGQPDVEIECTVDTGFEGALTLPHGAVAALGLPYLTDLAANLADGSTVRTDVYTATILWSGVEQDVAVLALNGSPLVGTALLAGHRLEIEFVHGGEVTIDTL